jgi:hypothetical protein
MSSGDGNRTPFNFEAVVPTKQVSTSPDDAIKEAEEDIFTAIYKTDLSAWGKRKELYRSNLGKAYTLIWQYCSIILQNKIQARQDFAQTIQDDPIALMSAIEEHALNMMEAWRNLGQIRQRDDEGVIEYAERFKTVRNIFVMQLGEKMKFPKMINAAWQANPIPNQTASVYDEATWEKVMSQSPKIW